MDWDQKILHDILEEIEKQKEIPGRFSIRSISNVPFVSYPNLTKQECEIVQEQVKNVLRLSRNENNYKEAAIIYSLSEPIINRKYFKLLGDYKSVFIMNKMKQCQEMVVISIQDGDFTDSDLAIFSENPSISLMIIVNRVGEISFLQRAYRQRGN